MARTERAPADLPGCVIVTGGSRGLGLELVSRFVSGGARVATFARRSTPDIERVSAAYPDRLMFAEIDARDERAAVAFVKEAERWSGRIWALVNNAAIGQDHLLAHTSTSTIDDLIDINLRAPILLTKSVAKRMILGDCGGRIVTVTSVCGLRGFQGLTVYSAAKGGLDAFTRALAREVGPRGILVNSVAPGFFSSEMSAVLTEEQMATIRRRSATGQLTEPAEVADVVEMLVFDGHNITGQTIVVDGGAIS